MWDWNPVFHGGGKLSRARKYVFAFASVNTRRSQETCGVRARRVRGERCGGENGMCKPRCCGQCSYYARLGGATRVAAWWEGVGVCWVAYGETGRAHFGISLPKEPRFHCCYGCIDLFRFASPEAFTSHELRSHRTSTMTLPLRTHAPRRKSTLFPRGPSTNYVPCTIHLHAPVRHQGA